MNHLLFYDGECGFCDAVVQFVLKRDKKGDFLFAPLQGKTAEIELKKLPPKLKTVDSLVLIENYKTPSQKIYVLGQGAFRVLWLLGGGWALLGWPNFLPPFLYDWGYRLVARNRQTLSQKLSCPLPDPSQKNRFLD